MLTQSPRLRSGGPRMGAGCVGWASGGPVGPRRWMKSLFAGGACVHLDLRETAGREAAHRRAAGVPRGGRAVRRRLLLPLDRGRLHRGRRQGPVRPLRGADRRVAVRRPDCAPRWRPRSWAAWRSCRFDTAGRVTLPESLCEMFGLTDWVVLVGLGDRFQIWSREAFQAHARRQRELRPRGRWPRPRAQQRARRARPAGADELTPPHTPGPAGRGAGGAGAAARQADRRRHLRRRRLQPRLPRAPAPSVVAFDRDPAARRFAAALGRQRPLPPGRGPFSDHGASIVGEAAADGVALDLGVSSMQLDEAERGFSFMRDGPLDMRMGDDGPTAADLVNEAEPAELARIFCVYGEERQARRIAARHRAPPRRAAVHPHPRSGRVGRAGAGRPARRQGASGHPRLPGAAHRGERRARASWRPGLRRRRAGAEGRRPPGGGQLPLAGGPHRQDLPRRARRPHAAAARATRRRSPRGRAPSFQLLFNGAHGPADAEIAANPRARSAKLRAAVRTAAPAWRAAA